MKIDYGKKGFKIAVLALVLALLAFSISGNVSTTTNITNYSGFQIIVNNSNLAPNVPGHPTGLGLRS